MRVDPLDDLAIQLCHQPQHAVGGRVLGPEVDRVVGNDIIAGGGRLLEDHAHFAGPFTLSSAFSSPGST